MSRGWQLEDDIQLPFTIYSVFNNVTKLADYNKTPDIGITIGFLNIACAVNSN